MEFNPKIIKSLLKKLKETNLPFYIYDTLSIKNNCQSILSIPYKNKAVHFASMANSSPKYIKIVKQCGLNIFVNSVPHLRLAQKLGYKNRTIVYTSSGMDLPTMKLVNESRALVNLDSVNQVKLWQKNFKNKKFGIRYNIAGVVEPKSTRAGYFIGKNSRLGLTFDEIKSLENKNLVYGLHLYVGTDLYDVEYFMACYKALAEVGKYFPGLNYLDFGGGFGINDSDGKMFSFKEYGEMITELMDFYSKEHKKVLKLILEPGRIIGGNAGYFVCKVTDIKHRNNTQLVGVNASSVQFPRPLFYPDDSYHPIQVVGKSKNIKFNNKMSTSVTGCSTYSRDYLATNQNLPEIDIGDVLVFGNAGSYCASSFTNFLGFPKPKEYFV